MATPAPDTASHRFVQHSGMAINDAGEAIGNGVHHAGEAVSNAGTAVGKGVHDAGAAVGHGIHNASAAVGAAATHAGEHVHHAIHDTGAAISSGVHHIHESLRNTWEHTPGVGSLLLISLVYIALLLVLCFAFMRARRIQRDKEEEDEDFYNALSEDGHSEEGGDRLVLQQKGFMGNTTDFREERSTGRLVEGMFTYTSGGHMLKYDLQNSVSYQVMFVFRNSLISNPTILKHMIISCAIAFLSFCLFSWLFVAFPTAALFRGDFLEDLDSMSTFITSLIGILLGFYISTVMSRWWSMRNDTLGMLWAAIDDIAVLMGSHFSGVEWRKLRTLVLRYMMASYELTFMQNEGTDNEVDVLVRRSLLTPDEAASLAGRPSKGQAIWTWIGYTFHELQKQGQMSDIILKMFYEKVVQGRSSIGGLFVYLDTQLPFMYVQLLASQVHFLSFLMAVSTGIATAKWISDPNQSSPVLKLFRMLMVTYFYNGCLELGRAFSDPCGNDFQDFPRHAFHFFMRNEAEFFHSAVERPLPYVQQIIQEATSYSGQPLPVQQAGLNPNPQSFKSVMPPPASISPTGGPQMSSVQVFPN